MLYELPNNDVGMFFNMMSFETKSPNKSKH